MVRILANGDIVPDDNCKAQVVHVVHHRARCHSDTSSEPTPIAKRRDRCHSDTSSGSSGSSETEPDKVEPPLTIQQIDISSSDISTVNKITYFGVAYVDVNSATRRRVVKRYSEFRRLADDIEFKDDFPRKHLRSCKGDRLEKRRLKLEAWLRMALLHQTNERFQDMRCSLREFLVDGSQLVQSHPKGTIPMPALPLPTAPSPPTSTALQAPRQHSAPDANAVIKLQVEIPAGMQPGQALQVAVPDGREVVLTIPEGYSGGMEVHVAFNSQDGSLTLMS